MEVKLYYITGYAGTGKSTALLEQAKTLPATSVVIAPTHKALKRLVNDLPAFIEVKTIHSLLGWIPTINENATHIAHINSTAKLDKPLAAYTHIIIDEAGMMSEEMLYDITAKIESLEPDEAMVELYLYLDPYQLLPVKGRQILVDPDATTNLTTQHRSDSIDIVKLYTKFVHYIEGKQKKDLTVKYSENVLKFDIKKFKPEDRLLAYTNAAVGQWNTKIAKQLGITSYIGQEVQLGSMLDTVSLVESIKLSDEEVISLFLNKALELQNSQINAKFLEHNLSLMNSLVDYYIVDNRENIYPVIEGIYKYYTLNNNAKKKAIEDKKNFKYVYAYNRIFSMDYTFASTVHKAQGSEFSTVFVDRQDIKKAIMPNYYMNYARMMYVAISRAKDKIFIN